MAAPRRSRPRGEKPDDRFSPQLMYAAATLYYREDATQAQIAERLGTSRATVSRLLSQARRSGVVRIEITPPPHDDALAVRAAEALQVRAVHLAPVSRDGLLGVSLAPALGTVLLGLGLKPDDVLLMSSGRTTYEIAQAELPPLGGLVIAPTLGGQDEPEAWYQTNEITRLFAEKVGGRPMLLYSPALPSPALHERLVDDPATRRVMGLWSRARCAIVGVGAPPHTRQSIPSFVSDHDPALRDAVGDVCNRFFDRRGRPLEFQGSERLVATSLEMLRDIRDTIAVAVGQEKVPSLIAAARGGWFNQLVTDPPTAAAVVAATGQGDEGATSRRG